MNDFPSVKAIGSASHSTEPIPKGSLKDTFFILAGSDLARNFSQLLLCQSNQVTKNLIFGILAQYFTNGIRILVGSQNGNTELWFIVNTEVQAFVLKIISLSA